MSPLHKENVGIGNLLTQKKANLAKAALRPFKQRQYSDKEPWSLSHQLRRAIVVQGLIAREQAKRVMYLAPPELPALVVTVRG